MNAATILEKIQSVLPKGAKFLAYQKIIHANPCKLRVKFTYEYLGNNYQSSISLHAGVKHVGDSGEH